MGMRSSSTAIKTVPVKKKELLEKLKQNKEKHAKEWRELFIGYQKAWLEEAKTRQAIINKVLAKAEEAINAEGFVTFPDRAFQCPSVSPPENHTPDYDMALAVIGAYQTIDQKDNVDHGIITLSIGDFNNFWLDDWDWKRGHQVSAMQYGAKGFLSPGVFGLEGPAGPTGPSITGALNELQY